MEKFQIRTDLALEAQERFREDHVEIPGVKIDEEYRKDTDIRITRVIIETENGSRVMQKPRGMYLTLEAPNMSVPDEAYHREISRELALKLKELLGGDEEKSVLVVGLGNREVTPDALGPDVVGNLLITRHIVNEYGVAAFEQERVNRISAIVPGVMAQTGMETLEILQGVVDRTRPDVMIAVDALAARSTRRLNRTIQISDAGIFPGSGVGNHRQALTRETLGIPVIAIGVPTVVDAATIVNDTMENLVEAMSQAESLKDLGYTLSQLDASEKYQLIRELISPQLNGMFVTPKDIDETVKRIGFTISEGINMALQIG
ncbi:MAG: GPR endopeptidase [Lachnospiraceae bacterium]|nr:GPR endopeptidase [Lachnospiraceae bacterium]MDY5647806.1 GPR endopeptidase [Lachnospiraceae bacterium]